MPRRKGGTTTKTRRSSGTKKKAPTSKKKAPSRTRKPKSKEIIVATEDDLKDIEEVEFDKDDIASAKAADGFAYEYDVDDDDKDTEKDVPKSRSGGYMYDWEDDDYSPPSGGYYSSQAKSYKTPAEPFTPHKFEENIIVEILTPRIRLTPRVYHDMLHIVDEAEKEIGWLGTVDVSEFGGRTYYRLDEIYIVEQEVSHTETGLDEEGQAKLAEALLKEPNGLELVNRLRFWGHSHVRMGVSPSGQDDAQMEHFRENGCDWFVRAIANKNGKIKFDVFDFESGILFEDVPWAIEYEEEEDRRDYWKDQIKEKVTEKTYVYKSGKPWRGGKKSGSYGGYPSKPSSVPSHSPAPGGGGAVPQHLRRFLEQRKD